MGQTKKAWYKRVWVWIGIIFLLGIIGVAVSGGGSAPTTKAPETKTDSAVQTESSQSKEEKPKKWDVEVAYAKINNGMTKTQVEAATGQKSDNCTESDMGQYGKSETCTYGNAFIDKANIIVTFTNGEVSTKTKSTY